MLLLKLLADNATGAELRGGADVGSGCDVEDGAIGGEFSIGEADDDAAVLVDGRPAAAAAVVVVVVVLLLPAAFTAPPPPPVRVLLAVAVVAVDGPPDLEVSLPMTRETLDYGDLFLFAFKSTLQRRN